MCDSRYDIWHWGRSEYGKGGDMKTDWYSADCKSCWLLLASSLILPSCQRHHQAHHSSIIVIIIIINITVIIIIIIVIDESQMALSQATLNRFRSKYWFPGHIIGNEDDYNECYNDKNEESDDNDDDDDEDEDEPRATIS